MGAGLNVWWTGVACPWCGHEVQAMLSDEHLWYRQWTDLVDWPVARHGFRCPGCQRKGTWMSLIGERMRRGRSKEAA